MTTDRHRLFQFFNKSIKNKKEAQFHLFANIYTAIKASLLKNLQKQRYYTT